MRRGWLLYLILIFSLSSLPGNPELHRLPVWWDKPAHLLLYAGLGWLHARASDRRAGKMRALLQSVLLSAVVGLGDELYQGLVPNRSQELMDWLADLSGGSAGAAAALAMRRKRPQEKLAT